MPMLSLCSPAYWFNVRDESLGMAKATRAILTDPEKGWRYSANDERVKRAVGKWLERARRAQAIAMGREPVIANCVVLRGADGVQGGLWVEMV